MADFKGQEVMLDVYAESPNIKYHPEHRQLIEDMNSSRDGQSVAGDKPE